MEEYRKSNLELWNNWALLHVASKTYDVASFKAGKNSLGSIELEEVGDVAGKTLIHLQCHFGKDTLSWARLGATVTGVDFSDKAIGIARELSAELGIPATFVQSDIYDLPNVLSGQFDIVFTSIRSHLLAERPGQVGQDSGELSQAGRHFLHRRVPPFPDGLRGR